MILPPGPANIGARACAIKKGTLQADVDDPIENGLSLRERRAEANGFENAGVIDEHIDTAVMRGGRRGDALDVCANRHIARFDRRSRP